MKEEIFSYMKSNMNNKLLDEKGMTLVEIITAMMLFAILSSVVFSFLDFSLDSFRYSNERIDEQAELRQVALKINELIRNAHTLETSSSGDTLLLDSNLRTDRIYLNNKTLMYENETSDRVLSQGTITHIEFGIDSRNGKYILTIAMEANDSTIDTEVLLNNINIADDVGDIDDETDIPASLVGTGGKSDLWFSFHK